MKTLLLLFFCMVASAMNAQDASIVRGNCTPVAETEAAASRAAVRRLPAINQQWDAGKTYRQLVVLLSFSDTGFQAENAQEVYDSIFNTEGYNLRQGKGSVADYFHEQSGGRLNLQFDVFGPYKVSTKAQPYDSPTESTRNYGTGPMREAASLMLAEQAGLDFTPYDWNGDGTIEQVIYVYAGYCGNQNSTKSFGHIWPNTGIFSAITTPDGKTISNYTCSGELWANNTSCGIGTICHEFTHSLGLPDIYPTSSSAGYSAVDEWDLMDGGNFTNYGWCPPNFSPLEKMLLGWLEPIELTEAATINDMKPISQGGEVYQVKHTDTEYLLLENRQWDGWDLGVPGKGLVVYHVNYVATAWRGNTVNNVKGKPNYSLVHADDISVYEDWFSLLMARGVSSQNAVYQNTGRLNSWIFSSATYPWATDSTDTVNDALTDSSVPAALMYNKNSAGSLLLQKPVTHIRQNADGTVSFRFMGGMKGDLNDDASITMADVVALTAIIALGGTDEQCQRADMNGDGKVDVADITSLQAIMAGAALPVSDEETSESY